MITIEQLLESVDLDFEPRWVTKDKDGTIGLFSCKPDIDVRGNFWERDGVDSYFMHNIKVSDFESKDWTECIYEVPRKEEPKDKIKIGTLYIDKSVTFGDGDDDDVGFALEDYEVPRKTTGKIEKLPEFDRTEASIFHAERLYSVVNEIIDWINDNYKDSK